MRDLPGRFVLPMKDNRPDVTSEGKLPCPALSLTVALHAVASRETEGPKLPEIKRVLAAGVQVEWVEFGSFLEWQLYMEEASVQSEVPGENNSFGDVTRETYFL